MLKEFLDASDLIQREATPTNYKIAYAGAESKIRDYYQAMDLEVQYAQSDLERSTQYLQEGRLDLDAKNLEVTTNYNKLQAAIANGADESVIFELETEYERSLAARDVRLEIIPTLEAAVTADTAKLSKAVDLKDGASAIQAALAAGKVEAASLGGVGKTIQNIADNIKAAKGWLILDAAGIFGDVLTLADGGARLDYYITTWKNAEATQQKYRGLLDALAAGRKQGPLSTAISVSSDPKNIEFAFSGSAVWDTTDSAYVDSNASHLTHLNGSFSNWDLAQDTGIGGSAWYTIAALGNLGSEQIRIDKDDTQILNLKTGTLSEQEVINLATPLIETEGAGARALAEALDKGGAIFGLAMAALGFMLAFTVVGAFVVAAISLTIEVTKRIIEWYANWKQDSGLKATIRDNFPSV